MKQILIPSFILLLLVGILLDLQAQDCDCLASDNCPLDITTNFTGEVCYEVTDAFNDDLSDPDQGICGVSITFTHAHIWDLELSLVSPAGQVVPLIGNNTSTFGSTNNMLWDILFIPCSASAQPDTFNMNPFEEVWDNDQSWPFAGVFTGSYYPVDNNCLESFDTGPVNGTWCLQIDNQPSTYSGEIVNFEIILCDNAGQLCCDALGGELPQEEVLSCEGDSSLLLNWSPQYGPIEPDTAEYAYTYLIADTGNVLLAYDSLPDLTGYSAGTYTVCGLSYLAADSLNLPSPDGVLTVDSLQSNLNGPTPWFCGDFSNDCATIEIVPPPATTFLAETICSGDSIAIGDSLFFTTGDYSVVLQTAAGCDSLVNLDLQVVPSDTTLLDELICEGETYAVGDSLYDATDIYETVLTNQFGCDSLVVLDLFVQPAVTTVLLDTICQGESYQLGDSTFFSTGNYTVPFISSVGCDSTVLLELTVIDLQAAIAPPATSTCAVPSVTLSVGSSSSGPGVSYQWSAVEGNLLGPLDQQTATTETSGTFVLEVSQASCSVVDTVIVPADTLAPVAEAGPPDTLTCIGTSLTLDGTGSSQGADYIYLWGSTDGSIVFGENLLTPLIDAPGTYSLTVTDTTNGCFAQDTVIVAIDTLSPFVEAGPGQVIDCTVSAVTLDGSSTYSDSIFVYQWTNAMGDTLQWQDSLQLTVTDPGWYFLNVFNVETGCQATDSTLVEEDLLLPAVEAGAPDTLTCTENVLTLDGTGSEVGPSISYQWSTPNGNILGSTDGLAAEADSAGTYFLTVTDTQSGCVSVDSVLLLSDQVFPLAEAGPSVELNCALTSFLLGDINNTSTGPEYAYVWENSAGDTIGTQINLEVTNGDIYTLIVTDLGNQCAASDQVLIEEDQQVPVADAGSGGTLTCSQQSLLLDGSNSSDGVFIEYAWYDSGGTIIATTETVSVDAPDTYCLVVSDGLNLCADTSCVTVDIDNALHIVDLPANEALDCFLGTATLAPTVDPVNPAYVYTWTVISGGGTIPDPGLPVIAVEEPGTYEVEVFNPLNSCTVTESVEVVLDTLNCLPQFDAGADGEINCYNVPFDTLQGVILNPTNLPLDFQWEALPGGSIFSGGGSLMPIVTEGSYVLAVSNPVLDITLTDTVIVGENLTLPLADAGPDQIIDCSILGNVFALDGTASSQNGPFVYQWDTDGGNIVSGENSLTPGINLPGLYDLVVTDTLNGCSSTSAVLIDVAGDLPTPCLTQPVQIPCGDTIAVIGDTCVANPPYTYAWNSLNGTIESDPAGSQIEVSLVDTSGLFTVWVTDTTNQCITIDSVEVFSSTTCFPDCVIETPDTITCEVPSVTLNASGSSTGPEFTYAWSTSDGNICGDIDALLLCADAPGIYELTVTDTASGFACNASVEVQADLTLPLAEAGDTLLIDCTTDTVSLNGTGSDVGNAFSYQWTGPAGCILAGEQTLAPTVVCDGSYVLTVENVLTGCVSSDSVWVLRDTLAPLAVLSPPDTLTCSADEVILDGSGSSSGPFISYTWTLDGNPVPGSAAQLGVSVPGTYCLEVNDGENGCVSLVCREVVLDTLAPIVSAGMAGTLDCSGVPVSLEVQPSGAYQLLWTGPTGCILGPTDQPSVLVNCVGTYSLNAEDPQNGCTTTVAMEVVPDTLTPVANAGADAAINCNQPTITLDGSNSTPFSQLSFSWTTTTGNILSGADGPEPEVDSAGWYFLEVVDTTNGCASLDSVFVANETQPPVADAGPDTALTCFTTQLTLDGSGSSQGAGLTYAWLGGNIIAGANSLQPLIDAPGTYVLEVVDTSTGCFVSDQVTVAIDTISPAVVVDLPQGDAFTCLVDTLILDGTNSLPLGDLAFVWTTQNGTILGDGDELSVPVISPGQYQLMVQDTSNGCTSSLTVNLANNTAPPDPVIAEPDLINCYQEIVWLDASESEPDSLAVNWTGPPGSILNPDSLLTQVTQAGLYTLLLTDLTNGCIDSTSVTVQADLEPPVAVAQTTGTLSCQVTSVPLFGNGSSTGPELTYEWSTTDGLLVGTVDQLSAVAGAAGSYSLIVTDLGNGCQDTALVQVVADSEPITGFFLDIADPGCEGSADGWIIIDSIGGGTTPVMFSLNGAPFDFYQQYGYLEAGTYALQAEDLNGCTADTLIVLENSFPVIVDLGPDWYIDLGDEVDLQAQVNLPTNLLASIQWDPIPDPDCPDCLETTVSPTTTTVYAISVESEAGCVGQDEVTIFVNTTDEIYAPNIFSPNGDGENDRFFLQSGREVAEIEYLQIFDRWGDLVFEASGFAPNDPNFGWDGQFEGRPMNSAVFVWQAEIRLQNGKRKFVAGDVLLVR